MKQDVYGITDKISTPDGDFQFFNLRKLSKDFPQVHTLPFSIRILLENVLRNYDGFAITEDHIRSIIDWNETSGKADIPYSPSRVLMQDFTGVPAVVDLASLRSEASRKGRDPDEINPHIPVDLVIDHSVVADFYGTLDSLERNVSLEYSRNEERYKLLKWAQLNLKNFRVVPPGTGICHQVNLEYLASGVTRRDGWVFPDTLVGTDSHTPMVNGIGVLGWGVGGIEAEAAMLGQPVFMTLPEVLGLRLTGKLPLGTTSTDLVLTIVKILRDIGVVGKFVEVFGPALDNLTVADRATISNMSPEFGCTNTHWPTDDQTLRYMATSGRLDSHIRLVESYCKENLLWRSNEDSVSYSALATLDLKDVEPTISGPRRPQDKILLKNAFQTVINILEKDFKRKYIPVSERVPNLNGNGSLRTLELGDELRYYFSDGSLSVASITSCTNTSNPSVMIGAGLLARNAVKLGLSVKPWVKTSLAPGSRVVSTYLQQAGLMPYLEALRFHIVGYGCTTCIGNSGDMKEEVQKATVDNDLVAAAILSGNRNFEARIHPNIKLNFLASPMLVVAYALVGRADADILQDPVGISPSGDAVYLKDIWPSRESIDEVVEKVIKPENFISNYQDVFKGDRQWEELEAEKSSLYRWDPSSTYIREAPFFVDLQLEQGVAEDIHKARIMMLLGDSITTDHISPAGKFLPEHPSGQFLESEGVRVRDFNSYGSRRGNHEVMVRGTFANVRIRNKIADREGGWTVHHPSGEVVSVYEASRRYAEQRTPLIVIGGKEYGSGSSRDWAAKGTFLLGIRAVIAESFERIHRSNLVGMGVLPMEFLENESSESLGITGSETFDILGMKSGLEPKKIVIVKVTGAQGRTFEFKSRLRLDSQVEVAYFLNGGILQYVFRNYLNKV